ncbi:MAG: matrixin family metalloprotease [Deltaproteobacteria bacterium]|nr:matrixin family metalloprotease [Deltaproteobacteria bacterium]
MIISQLVLSTLVLGWLPTGYRWNDGQLPVPYCAIGNATSTTLSSQQQLSELRRAIRTWESQGAGGQTGCTYYDAVESGTGAACRAAVDLNDGQNNIFWKSSNWNQGPTTLGVTHYWGSGNCRSGSMSLQCTAEADIEFNDQDVNWDNQGRQTDIAAIAQHEYGHFLGMGHCNENGTCDWGQAVMYASYSGGTMPPLFPDDVTGVCSMYPGQVGGFGYPCNGGGSCNSQICVVPAAGGSGFCTQTCGTCPDGYKCEANPTNPGQQVCVRDDGTNKQLCEQCEGNIAAACANNGVCVGGFPGNDGHCVTPCPNPGVPDGGCPEKYTCYSFQGGSNYCGPKSGDCGNLDNFTEIGFGVACQGNPPCASPYECIGICSQECQTNNPSSCPSGYACEAFQFQDQSGRVFEQNWCARAVTEGDNCSGLTACQTGPCLGDGQGPSICYLDCTTASTCNNAQTCNRYRVGNQTVGICEPAGVPPNPIFPDAGVAQPDTGTAPAPDSGVPMPPYDGGVVGCACDLTAACDLGCNCDPRCVECACDISTSCDQGCPCDTTCNAGACTCDTDYCCSPDCSCDQECQCACDQFFGCDDGCDCDPECDSSCPEFAGKGAISEDCNCNSAGGDARPILFGLLLLVAARALLRFRRG